MYIGITLELLAAAGVGARVPGRVEYGVGSREFLNSGGVLVTQAQQAGRPSGESGGPDTQLYQEAAPGLTVGLRTLVLY